LSYHEVDPSRRDELVAILDELLESSANDVRRAALFAVKKWGTDANVPALMKLTQSKTDSDVRGSIEALGEISKSEEVAQVISPFLLDTGHRLRAKLALRKMGANAEPAVLEYVGHRDNLAHNYACDVIEEIGGEKSLQKLKSLPPDADEFRQSMVRNAIQRIERRLNR
jgi:hypothetical protein